MDILNEARPLAGPFKLYDGSFLIEFLEPPKSINSSVLMKSTFLAGHPLNKTAKAHPQVPPLHIHFDQSETFCVVQGRMGTTLGWSAEDRIFTNADAPHEIKPWTPHTFWPAPPESGHEDVDIILLVWAHPKDSPEAMDHVFFQVLLTMISDAYEQGKFPSLLQLMLTQHISGSALVVLPRAWWLGPLRWYPLFALQGATAAVAKSLGYKPLPEEYTKKRS